MISEAPADDTAAIIKADGFNLLTRQRFAGMIIIRRKKLLKLCSLPDK